MYMGSGNGQKVGCRLVFWFYACAVENPEISFCVSETRGLRTDHKRVKRIETVLFCNVDKENMLEII